MASRLYLEKPENIYVDPKQPLLQHQIDGIRFLYRQYRNKSPGVILNDPPGNGKCLQVATFLDALRPTLKKQILVICDDYEDMETWKERFENWTEFKEVAVSTDASVAKKQILITFSGDLKSESKQRRCYSIVIMRDRWFNNDILHTAFDADFKIWVTSLDMKENLETFYKIYQWIDPGSKVDVLPGYKKNVAGVVSTAEAVFVDACLEDIVVRGNSLSTSIKAKDPHKKQKAPPQKQTSRKNKDPTGTKVKRSKKRILDDDDDADIPLIVKKSATDNVKTLNDDKTSNSNKEMDIESFIREQKPIDLNEFNELTSDSDNVPQNSSNVLPMTEESNSMCNFQNAINEMVHNENNVVTKSNSPQFPAAFTETVEKPDGAEINEVNNDKSSNILIKNISLADELAWAVQDIHKYESIDKNDKNGVPEQIGECRNNVKIVSSESESANNKAPDVTKFEEKAIELVEICNTDVKTESNTLKPIKDISDKIADLEAQALKKFKGSLLDSIF